MAEEPLDGQQAAEPAAAPAEGGEGEQINTEQQTDPAIAALATKMGWVPPEEFRGDPSECKSAEEYILASKDINRSLSRDLRGVREELSRVGSVTSQIVADKIAERDRYWQQQHQKAVDDGNHELAAQAVGELVKLKAEPQSGNSSGEPSETLAFKERHKAWFGVNRLATGRAMEVAERSRQLGATVAEQLQDAEDAVRREFADLFPKPAKAPAAVQTGSQRNNGNGSGKKSFADMPPASQAMARDFEKRHGMPIEKFAESYWADMAQNERRVG